MEKVKRPLLTRLRNTYLKQKTMPTSVEHLKGVLGGSPGLAHDLISNHLSRAGLSNGTRGRFSNAGQIEAVRGAPQRWEGKPLLSSPA